MLRRRGCRPDVSVKPPCATSQQSHSTSCLRHACENGASRQASGPPKHSAQAGAERGVARCVSALPKPGAAFQKLQHFLSSSKYSGGLVRTAPAPPFCNGFAPPTRAVMPRSLGRTALRACRSAIDQQRVSVHACTSACSSLDRLDAGCQEARDCSTAACGVTPPHHQQRPSAFASTAAAPWIDGRSYSSNA